MRFKKIEGLDYKKGAIEYPTRLAPNDRHHLLTKPFYNLSHKKDRWPGEGLDPDTHRHFCDFANMAMALALPPGARILDVGCGPGWLCEFFARFGYNVTGIDLSPDLIEIARDRLSKVPYGADHEIGLKYHFLVHDIEADPLPETFDAIVCYDSLHHFEDERAVLQNVAAMLDTGGLFFVLEGERPPEGSQTEAELRGVMREYEILESPFDRQYLLELVRDAGLAVVGDYISVNGLQDRAALDRDRLQLNEQPAFNYLLCRKVPTGENVPDSRNPLTLWAKFSEQAQPPAAIEAGSIIELPIAIQNTGDTIWIVSRSATRGTVRLGIKVLDDHNSVIDEVHGAPPLPHSVLPGETVIVTIKQPVPITNGKYTLKIDLVCQDICWFEERGSEPLVVAFEVS